MAKCGFGHGPAGWYESKTPGGRVNSYCRTCRRLGVKINDPRTWPNARPPDNGDDSVELPDLDLSAHEIERLTLLFTTGKAADIANKYGPGAQDLADEVGVNYGTALRWLRGATPQRGHQRAAAEWLAGIEYANQCDDDLLRRHGYPPNREGARRHSEDNEAGKGCGGIDNNCQKCRNHLDYATSLLDA